MSTEHKNQDIYVGVRPEGFIVDNKKGVFTCELERVEVMGREKSVICKCSECESPVVRAIVEDFENKGEETVTFSFKKGKVFLFNRETERRL
jgi:multiple sugar transport system ATP-binding protein